MLLTSFAPLHNSAELGLFRSNTTPVADRCGGKLHISFQYLPGKAAPVYRHIPARRGRAPFSGVWVLAIASTKNQFAFLQASYI
jgi:hypothetical protein